MYTILIRDNNEMITSIYEKIIQGSKTNQTIRFLVPTAYKNMSIKEYELYITYTLPVNKTVGTIVLNKEDSLYKSNMEYLFEMDDVFTKYAGKVEINVLLKNDEQTRVIAPYYINICSNSSDDSVDCDSNLSVMDQKISQMQTTINELKDKQNSLTNKTASNLVLDLENNNIHLENDNGQIDNNITLADLEKAISGSTKDGLIYLTINDEKQK